MRLLIASAGVSIPGGIATVSRSLLHTLEDRRRSGDLDWLGLLELHGETSDVADLDWHRSTDSNQVAFGSHLAAVVLRQRVDLIVFDTVGIARSSRLLIGPIRPPYVVIVHGREIDRITDRRSSVDSLLGARRIIAVSKTSKERLTASFGRNLPPVGVIPPCVPRERIAEWDADSVIPPADVPLVLSVGRMVRGEPGKGHDTLIKAHRDVAAAIPGARLTIAGDGDGRHDLQQLAQFEGVEQLVQLPGYVTDQELGRLYRSASVFALPSRQEGFGIVYAEAMWHGLPCVGSTADAARDVIQADVTGRLIKYGDVEGATAALVEILEDDSLAARLGAEGRARCLSEYAPDVFDSKWLNTLASI